MQRRTFLQKASLIALGAFATPQQLFGTEYQLLNPSFPFTDIHGNPFSMREDTPSLDETVTRTIAATLAEAQTLHDTEFAAVEEHLAIRKNRLAPFLNYISSQGSWHHPHLEDANKKPLVLRTNKLTTDEESLLHDVDFFGRELTNPQNAYRYDPTWTRLLRQRFNLQPTDCTHYALEAYARATADDLLLKEYLAREYKQRTFPWVFSMRLKNDYETVMVIPNTKSEQRYFNGSVKGWTNKQLVENIKQGWYYTATNYEAVPSWFRKQFLNEQGITPDNQVIDYYVLDEQTTTPSFKKFIERNKGIGIKQEFVHVHLFNGNDLYEADWGNNPLYANTFEKTNLYERLHSENSTDKIHNIVLWVPRGSVQAHLWRTRQEDGYHFDKILMKKATLPLISSERKNNLR